MVQKAPNARQRFETAALALFQDRGVARTTVPDIAARAQLTERTFYRYFSDKREVLFWRAGVRLAGLRRREIALRRSAGTI